MTTTLAAAAILILGFAVPQGVTATLLGDFGDALDRAGGDFNQGTRDGKAAGVDDAMSGRSFNLDCPRNGVQEPAYCAGYDAGYADGWRSANIVAGN